MTMVESSKHCVLRWTGHAGYVAERLSGLLARQALVDVTLICEGQELRVHKLVLASNSTYFEEILQQDLGQEPVIFLRDLNFEILKAMVEFMYCGETTISYAYLPSLSTAAKIFKVKELSGVIDAIMESEMVERFEQGKTSDERMLFRINDNDDLTFSENQTIENELVIESSVEHDSEHTLYEESYECNERNVDDFIPEEHNEADDINFELKDMTSRYAKTDVVNESQDLKPSLYEQCCDFSSIDDRDGTSGSCNEESEENDDAATSVTETVKGKCVKVYTRKRRKSMDEVRSKLVRIDNSLPSSESTDCIDLSEEPSNNDIPVNLLSSLDMESADYILSLSAENIHSIVGGAMSDYSLIRCKDVSPSKELRDLAMNDEEKGRSKESSPVDGENVNSSRPMPRRSTRLNHQETEESVKVNSEGKTQLKQFTSLSRTESWSKGKRRAKDTDRKVPDQNTVSTIQSRKNVNSSKSKSTPKLIMKKNTNKSACIASVKEKEDQKVKNEKSIEKMEADIPFLATTKMNTIKYINRSLWGDMSDSLDDDQNELYLSGHTENTEIPFAVGLLPLRTALEKMQATPDYQPRKTRSSVAPIRQETGFKRKADMISKVQNNNQTNEGANTVCHIRIRTAPSQYVKSRKKFLQQHIAALEPAAVMNKE